MKADALAELRSKKLATTPTAAELPLIPVRSSVELRNPNVGVGRTTATMSLYSADLERLKEIRRKLEDSGIKRVSDSEAVRVALRHVSLNLEGLITAYRAMQSDDRRRNRKVDTQV
jgi:hypothetical protein